MTKPANKKFLALLIAAFLVSTFALGWWFGQTPAEPSRPGDDGSKAAEVTGTDNDAIWTCSMHPQIRQPGPGQCPICGMDLIPVAADESPAGESDLPRLRVSERSAALMNVQTWPVERRVVEREVRLLGTVNYDERRRRTVTAWVPGRLDRLFVNIEGARVQRGDPIAEIYSPALISGQEELLQALRTARARSAEDAPMVQAARERLRLLGLNTDQIREIEEGGAVQDHIVIHSPLDGIITQRIAVEGTFVEAGDPIAALAALDRVFVDLEAYERDLPWLAEGQSARFSVEGLAGQSFEGNVDQINPFIDPAKRTAQVRVQVENPNGLLKPGMFARGVIVSRLGEANGIDQWRDEPPVVIPATAALITGRRAVVYVKIPDTDRPTFELRQVTLGPRAGDRYVVHDGVSEGELVVTNGNFKIDSELQLRGRPSMMAQPEQPEAVPPGVGHDHPALAISKEDVPENVAEQAVRLVESYFQLNAALAEDDFRVAAEAVIGLHDRTGAIDAFDLSGPAARAWGSLSPHLHTSIHEMANAEDLPGLREHLETLTDQVELVVRSLAAGQIYPVYRAHCPMAFDDEGADWLQQGEELVNPYMGTAMPRCGEIRHQVAPDPAEKKEKAEPEELRDEPEPLASPEEVPESFREDVGRLAEQYLELAEQLADDEFHPAQTAAAEMMGAIEQIDDERLDGESREDWRRLQDDMTEALEEAVLASNIERVREMLQPITDALEVAMVSFASPTAEPLQRAYCPMAFDDLGGTWLQRGEEIRNPYFGAPMLRCGENLGPLEASGTGQD